MMATKERKKKPNTKTSKNLAHGLKADDLEINAIIQTITPPDGETSKHSLFKQYITGTHELPPIMSNFTATKVFRVESTNNTINKSIKTLYSSLTSLYKSESVIINPKVFENANLFQNFISFIFSKL